MGGGPAGLMAAEVLSKGGIPVDLYEAMPSVGRKFLVAGKGGLNLTHSEPFDQFLTRYGNRVDNLRPFLEKFGPLQFQDWVHELGFETFTGTSGRVFPKGMKSSPILRAWIQRLSSGGIQFNYRHYWLGWGQENRCLFETPSGKREITGDVLILALGGGSRPELGSTAEWVPVLTEKGIDINPFKPSNCGFNVDWNDLFSTRYEGEPVRQVVVSFKDSIGNVFKQQGEFIISKYGLEGSLIYAVSSLLREEIERTGKTTIQLDLAPDWSLEKLTNRLSMERGKRSMTSHLRKTIGFEGVKTGLLQELLPKEIILEPNQLAGRIKQLSIPLVSPRPLTEAISSAGGVSFESLDERLMLNDMPGVFCAGEMLDWEAPTGGYLLTACFATGFQAGHSALEYLKQLV